VDALDVRVFDDDAKLAADAARDAATAIDRAVGERGAARVIFASGNSQFAFVDALLTLDVAWERVTGFHMDEYVGVGTDHPAAFARWMRDRIASRTAIMFEYIDGRAPADAECARYAALLAAAPIDLCCLGIGENGHLAFNDPPVANFADPLDVKVVELDHACRAQQVGEGHFASLDDVPATALTVTIPALLRAERVLAVVPERRKAEAVRAALTRPIEEACPASVLRRAPHASLFLDEHSASLVPELSSLAPPQQGGSAP
jgi:glucosamine-6-phosphate deaminase